VKKVARKKPAMKSAMKPIKKGVPKKATPKKPARYYFASVQDARNRLTVLDRERRIAKNDSPELYNEMMAIKMMLEKANRA
jgi:hypothetical protein